MIGMSVGNSERLDLFHLDFERPRVVEQGLLPNPGVEKNRARSQPGFPKVLLLQ